MGDQEKTQDASFATPAGPQDDSRLEVWCALSSSPGHSTRLFAGNISGLRMTQGRECDEAATFSSANLQRETQNESFLRIRSSVFSITCSSVRSVESITSASSAGTKGDAARLLSR